jgi:hypothetical protein
MSWLYSQALVVAFSEATSSDGARSALSNGSPTPRAFLPPDRTTAFSRPSRFGMTFGPLTDDLGAELLTWFLAASRAKTSALPAKGQESKESDPACGATWRASWARFDHATSSWKTAQPSLLGDSDEFSVTWPRSGMTADGQCWELPTLARTTNASDSGLWPTPLVPNGGRSIRHAEIRGRSAYSNGKKVQIDLAAAVRMWPTPTVCGNYNRKGASATSGDGLPTAVKLWATPVRRDYRHPGRSRLERTGSKAGDPLPQQVGGALNPMWVEWLMGWPLGWTDLKPSATDRCHSAPLQPGDFSLSQANDNERKSAAENAVA